MNDYLPQDLSKGNNHVLTNLIREENSSNKIKMTINNEGREDFEKFRILYKEGLREGFEYESIDEIEKRPEWLDEALLRSGQEFAKEFYISIGFCQQLALYILLAEENGRGILVATNKSNTGETAAKRYVSTVSRIKTWYTDDILNQNSEAFRNLRVVSSYHAATFSSLNKLSEEEFQKYSDLDYFVAPSEQNVSLCPILYRSASSHPFLEELQMVKRLRFNQGDMIITLFSLMGMVVLFPAVFGIPQNERARLEGFLHLWRYIMHMLGLRDKYNVCSGNLEEVCHKFTLLLEHLLKPLLVHTLDRKWEHMTRNAVEGLGPKTIPSCFESNLVFLWQTIGIDYSKIYNVLNWKQKMYFYFIKTFYFLYSKKWIRYCINLYIDK